MKWNYVDTDGNPQKEGVYWATIIYHGWDREKQEPNDDKYVMIDTRYFCNAKEKEIDGWKMDDQPDSGLVWTEETGSMPSESVWAWAEMEETPFPDRLPEGVTKCQD